MTINLLKVTSIPFTFPPHFYRLFHPLSAEMAVGRGEKFNVSVTYTHLNSSRRNRIESVDVCWRKATEWGFMLHSAFSMLGQFWAQSAHYGNMTDL